MGSRFIGRKRSVLHFWHMTGNKVITLLFNLLNNTTFTDIYCCYCMFKKELINHEKLKSYGWGQQAEILTYLVKNSDKIFEIGINYNARNYKEGKKQGLYKEYYKNGQLISVGNYNDGKENGLWKYYKADGSLRLAANYKNGVLVD